MLKFARTISRTTQDFCLAQVQPAFNGLGFKFNHFFKCRLACFEPSRLAQYGTVGHPVFGDAGLECECFFKRLDRFDGLTGPFVCDAKCIPSIRKIGVKFRRPDDACDRLFVFLFLNEVNITASTLFPLVNITTTEELVCNDTDYSEDINYLKLRVSLE